MRKNRFLLNLIAATAVGLSVFGCDSSTSGAVSDTTDIAVVANENSVTEAQRLREYMVVAQRGSQPVEIVPGVGQSIPASVDGDRVFGGSADEVIDDSRALLFELFGIADLPQPNLTIAGPGGSDDPTSPLVDGSTDNAGTTGYHVMEVDPTGQFAIGISRNRGATTAQTQIQIFALTVEPLDVSFPPEITFENTASVLPILFFDDAPTSQGEFVAGAWSATGQQFYASINDQMFTIPVNVGTGVFDIPGIQSVPFPAGGTGRNNAAQIINTADGRFVFAIDNANNQIVRWDRELGTGLLSNATLIPTVVDPHGATLDRSGSYMYVVGRDSGLLAGYSLGDDGGLTPIQLFAAVNGTAPADFATRLGDVDANPRIDQLILATYDGLLQAYGIDPATGLLTVQGGGGTVIGTSSNVANIEVEPTGRFVVTAQESALEDTTSFLNLDTATNGVAENSPQGETDANGNVAFFLPEGQAVDTADRGGIQGFSIGADGSLGFVSSAESNNPHGISFFQKVFVPPAAANTSPGAITAPDPVSNGALQP